MSQLCNPSLRLHYHDNQLQGCCQVSPRTRTHTLSHAYTLTHMLYMQHNEVIPHCFFIGMC